MASHDTITVTDYLLRRLESLGVRHIFGVPGDYNLKLLDTVIAHPGIEWVGTANELGAAYAVDGYARMTGFGALVTTFGVGELSAINGVAGSFAERVPMVHLAVGPAQEMERSGAILHHTTGDGDYERFARAHEQITCAQAVLRPGTAGAEIDRVLTTALRESRPVYLRLPADVAAERIPAPTAPLPLPGAADVNPDSLAAFLDAAEQAVAEADSAAVLADFLADRFHARTELAEFLAASGFPVATLSTGKTVVDEQNPQFVGVYSGQFSDPRTRVAIDEAGLLIRVGVLLADTTSGGFSQGFDPEAGIDLGPYSAAVDGKRFDGVPMAAALAGLAQRLGTVPAPQRIPVSPMPVERGGDEPLTQNYLWDAVAAAVRPWNTVVAEQGTSFFGIATRHLPTGTRFIGQPLWGSIGYTLPALLGAQIADPTRRGVLLIGDGSAQLTIQELGTIARHGLTPVIILVNNDGYTVERAIHGKRAVYNDIAPWNWSAIPGALGASNALVLHARTAAELDHALAEAALATDRLVFLEVVTDIDDTPALLTGFAEGVGARNGSDS
ncbi:alpha-keto acid decarboxylase family protein [Nocardia terpenica]|uniref:Alpha-keto-acid decarboxylase n=1 Tax=Nocardia terpenica TaxID=455432 RepID=A0A291RTA4_9NOCA|nr:thiamine pyrophosphate-binding protein [Nocardia terpenica]ATL70509.1 indolepyruvate decarboxylase [Nocardia terpenica]